MDNTDKSLRYKDPRYRHLGKKAPWDSRFVKQVQELFERGATRPQVAEYFDLSERNMDSLLATNGNLKPARYYRKPETRHFWSEEETDFLKRSLLGAQKKGVSRQEVTKRVAEELNLPDTVVKYKIFNLPSEYRPSTLHKWSKEEIALVIQMYVEGEGYDVISKRVGIPQEKVKAKISHLKKKGKIPKIEVNLWSSEELNVLKLNWGKNVYDLSRILDRPVAGVRQKVISLEENEGWPPRDHSLNCKPKEEKVYTKYPLEEFRSLLGKNQREWPPKAVEILGDLINDGWSVAEVSNATGVGTFVLYRKARQCGLIEEGSVSFQPTPVKRGVWTEERVETLTRMFYRGLSYKEMAEALGMRENQIRDNLTRMKARGELTQVPLSTIKKWYQDEVYFLAGHLPPRGVNYCAKKLDKDPAEVRTMWELVVQHGPEGLGVLERKFKTAPKQKARPKMSRWEKEEEDFLLANYQNKGLQECARVLNRTEVAVYQRWLELRKKVQVY